MNEAKNRSFTDYCLATFVDSIPETATRKGRKQLPKVRLAIEASSWKVTRIAAMACCARQIGNGVLLEKNEGCDVSEVRVYPDLVLCEHCDEVYERQAMARGTSHFCSRCGSRLGKGSLLSIGAWLAWTVTAACLFIFANTFPVATISFDGLQSTATIWQSISALAQGPGTPTAIAAGLVIIGIPAFQIALLLWMLSFAVAGKACPYFVATMRFLHFSRPWGMTEVFLLGVLVAIVKLSSYLHVVVGAGVVSVALLAPLMVVITAHDTDELWHLYERHLPCRVA